MTPITINDYVNKIRYLSKLLDNVVLTNEQLEEISDIFKKVKSDLRTELNFIKLSNTELINKLKEVYNKNRSLIGYLNVIFVLKRNLNMEVDDLKAVIMKISNDIIIEREENLINDKNLIDLDINYINSELFGPYNKLSSELERLIFGLYTLLPPRRLDYRFLTLIKDKNDLLNETDLNYIYLDGDNITFIFNEYKTKFKYKQQQFEFNKPNLAFIINDYINKFDIQNNEHLFTDKKNKIMTHDKFSKLIKKVFYKVYQKKITMNDIRHSWSNKINQEIHHTTLKELTEITNYMGHSVIENLKYRRLV